MPADVDFTDKVFSLEHGFKLGVEPTAYSLDVADRWHSAVFLGRSQVLFNESSEGLDGGRDDFPFFVVEQLLQLGVDVLP